MELKGKKIYFLGDSITEGVGASDTEHCYVSVFKLFKISKEHYAKYITVATIVSSICGMAFNIVADPVVGYFYKTYLLGVPQDLAKALAKIGAITTTVNAIIAVIVASILYIALRPVMKKTDMLRDL